MQIQHSVSRLGHNSSRDPQSFSEEQKKKKLTIVLEKFSRLSSLPCYAMRNTSMQPSRNLESFCNLKKKKSNKDDLQCSNTSCFSDDMTNTVCRLRLVPPRCSALRRRQMPVLAASEQPALIRPNGEASCSLQ